MCISQETRKYDNKHFNNSTTCFNYDLTSPIYFRKIIWLVFRLKKKITTKHSLNGIKTEVFENVILKCTYKFQKSEFELLI